MDGFYLLSFYSKQNLNLILTFRPFVELRLSETANERFKLKNSQNWKSASKTAKDNSYGGKWRESIDFRTVIMTINDKQKGKLGHVVQTTVPICRKRDSKSRSCERNLSAIDIFVRALYLPYSCN